MERRAAHVPLWFLFAMWLLIVAAFALGVFFARRSELPEPQATALRLIHQEILRSHVDAQDPAALLDRAIGAMVGGLDEYSEYVPPRELPAFLEATTGTYEGIGVAVHVDADKLWVRFPFAGGPAERAGLLPGDEIVAIEGTPFRATPADERGQFVEQRLRGPAGGHVHLSIRRAQRDLEIDVERGPVHKASIRWTQMLEPESGLGYVYFADFHPGSCAELQAAIERLQQMPGGLRGLVLDLRFDGGGSLDECVAAARLFVAAGNIVSVRRRGSEVLQSYDAERAQCLFPDLPLCLLVNEHTASASEVLTGALQDHGRAAVVGTRTFGKGMVNTVFRWEGLDFRLKLTTGHYYTPNGRNLEKHGGGEGGIAPDVAVAVDDVLRQALLAALRAHEVPERHLAAAAAFAAAHGLRLPGILKPAADPQLAAALAALRARIAPPGGR